MLVTFVNNLKLFSHLFNEQDALFDTFYDEFRVLKTLYLTLFDVFRVYKIMFDGFRHVFRIYLGDLLDTFDVFRVNFVDAICLTLFGVFRVNKTLKHHLLYGTDDLFDTFTLTQNLKLKVTENSILLTYKH